MPDASAQPNILAQRRVRNGIFALAGLSLIILGIMRVAGVDVAILRISAIASGLLVVSLFMTYRAMTTALDAGLAVEREHAAQLKTLPTDPTHDASSGALPPRPE